MNLSAIRTDGGTQPRAELSEETIQEYAEAMAGGSIFPPVTVFYDGSDYWLADGFHRWHAAKRLDLSDISAEVRQGSLRDAVLYSVSANATHGMRRTNEDKRRAVTRLLEDSEWSQWSNREIARRCAVSEYMVRAMRPDTAIKSQYDRKFIHPKTGEPTRMNTSNIGNNPVGPAPAYGYPRDPEELKADVESYEIKTAPTPQERWDDTPTAKAMVTLIRRWRGELKEAMQAAELGKLSPEAQRFMAKRLRDFAGELMDLAEEMTT